MFEDLKKYKKILVTGPHRAGTTIATKMIASDLKYLPLLDEQCGVGPNLEPLTFYLHDYSKPCVCQAPFAADSCHTFNDDVLVVFMMRDLEDIAASQRRVKLEDGRKFDFAAIIARETRRYHTGSLGEPIAQIKYRNWEEQKLHIKHWLELPYTDLENHPMWLPKEQRKDFHVRQTHAG
jgi:hypothetical protein